MLLRQLCVDPRLVDNAGKTAHDTARFMQQQREQQHGQRVEVNRLVPGDPDVLTLFASWEHWELQQRGVLGCLKRLALATSFLGPTKPGSRVDCGVREPACTLASLPRRGDGGGDLHDMIVYWYGQRCRDTGACSPDDRNVSMPAELQQWLLTSASETPASSNASSLAMSTSSSIAAQPLLWSPPMI
jgi:hypothetical protein